MDLQRIQLIEKIADLSSAIVKEKQLYDTACCLVELLSGASSSLENILQASPLPKWDDSPSKAFAGIQMVFPDFKTEIDSSFMSIARYMSSELERDLVFWRQKKEDAYLPLRKISNVLAELVAQEVYSKIPYHVESSPLFKKVSKELSRKLAEFSSEYEREVCRGLYIFLRSSDRIDYFRRDQTIRNTLEVLFEVCPGFGLEGLQSLDGHCVTVSLRKADRKVVYQGIYLTE